MAIVVSHSALRCYFRGMTRVTPIAALKWRCQSCRVWVVTTERQLEADRHRMQAEIRRLEARIDYLEKRVPRDADD